MKRFLPAALAFLAGLTLGVTLTFLLGPARSAETLPRAVASNERPALLTFSAMIDGSDRFVFTRDVVSHQHLRWSPPRNVLFNGEPWSDLSAPPPGWAELVEKLDLSRAAIATRQGRDVVALEHTADGFDLYFADSLVGAATYEVIISVPRK